jgi:hypothetical protein
MGNYNISFAPGFISLNLFNDHGASLILIEDHLGLSSPRVVHASCVCKYARGHREVICASREDDSDYDQHMLFLLNEMLVLLVLLLRVYNFYTVIFKMAEWYVPGIVTKIQTILVILVICENL